MGCGASNNSGVESRGKTSNSQKASQPQKAYYPQDVAVMNELSHEAVKQLVGVDEQLPNAQYNTEVYECDMFEEKTIEPLPERDDKYQCCGPTTDGDEVTACFDKGLLYKIVKDTTWSFYNDTRVYEMHIEFTFGKNSALVPLGNTSLSRNSTGEWTASAICYPCETIQYVEGSVAGFESKIKALPLSEDFLKATADTMHQKCHAEMEQLPESVDEDTEYDVLRKCVEHGTPFVDARFPPCQESIAKGAKRPMKTMPWARPSTFLPKELVAQERLFRNPIVPSVIDAGDLGDSWVISAMAGLARYPEILRSLFRHPQSPELTAKERAVGAYRVTLNHNGWWRSVVVDNYLPVVGSLPKYAKSFNDPCEMWVSILEKAFAKTYGSYANIMAGDPLAALQDFTGFPTSRYDDELEEDIRNRTDKLFDRILEFLNHGRIVVLSTPNRDPNDQELEEKYSKVGLVLGNTYYVKKVVRYPMEGVALVHLFNPWSRNTTWKGAWSADNAMWEVHSHITDACEPSADAESSFWISWTDIINYFSGCGVVFSPGACEDVRISGTFSGKFPSTALVVKVTEQVDVISILSIPDRRGTEQQDVPYQPIMLSLCEGNGSMEAMQVVQNTNVNTDMPSTKFTFSQSRCTSMLCTLTPEHSPYLLLPRVMPNADESRPYVLGLLSNERIGGDEFKVEFVSMPDDSPAFNNFPTFNAEGLKSATADYQVKRQEAWFPEERCGKTYVGEA